MLDVYKDIINYVNINNFSYKQIDVLIRKQVVDTINFFSFPELETKNLILRRMNNDDAKELYEMRKDPRMSEFTDTKLDESIDDTYCYIDKMNKGIDDGKWIIWAIVHNQTNKVIGSISIWNFKSEQKSGELGYGIIPDYQGKGLMKEALLRVLDYGFEVMNLEVLEAYTEENNLKSVSLLNTCNFVKVDEVEEEGYFNDKIYHMLVYRIKK